MLATVLLQAVQLQDIVAPAVPQLDFGALALPDFGVADLMPAPLPDMGVPAAAALGAPPDWAGAGA